MVSAWQNAVEQHINVRASAEQVWALVSVPGWFISRLPEAPAVERVDERLTLVRDGELGPFLIRTLELVEPSYAAFRWELLGGSSLEPTLIQFWITNDGPGTVLLKVRESGFAPRPDGDGEEPGTLDENNAGWAEALEAVHRFF